MSQETDLTIGQDAEASSIIEKGSPVIQTARMNVSEKLGIPLDKVEIWWIAEADDARPNVEVPLGELKLVDYIEVTFVPTLEPAAFELYLRLKSGDWHLIPWTQYTNGSEGLPTAAARAVVPGGPDLYDRALFKIIKKANLDDCIGVYKFEVRGLDLAKLPIDDGNGKTVTVYGKTNDYGLSVKITRPEFNTVGTSIPGICMVRRPGVGGLWSADLVANRFVPDYTISVTTGSGQTLTKTVRLPEDRNSVAWESL